MGPEGLRFQRNLPQLLRHARGGGLSSYLPPLTVPQCGGKGGRIKVGCKWRKNINSKASLLGPLIYPTLIPPVSLLEWGEI